MFCHYDNRRCRIRNLLKRHGLYKAYRLYFPVLDDDGEPTGDLIFNGMIYGYFYSEKSGITINVDIPGVSFGDNSICLLEVMGDKMLEVNKNDVIKTDSGKRYVVESIEDDNIVRVLSFSQGVK